MRVPTAFVVAGLCSMPSGQAWSTPNVNNNAQVSRKSVLETFVKGGAATVAASFLSPQQPAFATTETLPTGVTYEVIKTGSGPKPEVGELVAIRFAAYFGDRKIDDIFETPEPYYTRLGSGGLLKGVESTLPLMRVGDRWKLTIPGQLAFGPKGRCVRFEKKPF
jgi:FKBP-type peptidyl-prolyl cis-trans isomerase